MTTPRLFAHPTPSLLQTQKLLLLITVLATFLLLGGCAQRESDAGDSAIPVAPDGYEGRTLIPASRSAEWDADFSTGRGQYLQIGHTASYTAVSALRFQPSDILPDSFTLDTARIRFRVDRVYPNPQDAPDLRMLIRSITSPWDEDSLNEGVFADRASYPVIDTLLLPTEAATDTANIPTAYWMVPDSIWRNWLLDDSLNYGILLEPENDGMIVGVQTAEGATNYAVQLEIIGKQYPESLEFAATEWSDTLFAQDDGYVAVDSSDSLSGRLRVAQGVYRRALLYFPLDSVTANPLRTVVRAWLHFYADVNASNSVVYEGSNFVYKDATLQDTTWFAASDSAKLNLIAASSTIFSADNRELAFEVTNSLAGIVGVPSTNGGFAVEATFESDVLSRQYFHGHDSEVDSLRPVLEIWWVEP